MANNYNHQPRFDPYAEGAHNNNDVNNNTDYAYYNNDAVPPVPPHNRDPEYYSHHPDPVPQSSHNPYAEPHPNAYGNRPLDTNTPYSYPTSDEKLHSPNAGGDLPINYADGNSDFNAIDPNSGVKRGLKTRHLSMMALAGIIGPGLLIGSGGALARGGPASLIIGFGVIGIVAFSIMQSLGELTTLYPTGGAFTGLADRFVDKAFGVSLGWNYFIIWFCVLANEYNVLTSIFSVWTTKVPQWGFFLIFWFAFLAFQLLGVESFGEAEFWLALIKLIGLFAYFIFSIVYAAGGVKGAPAIGFSYWNDPGAFTNGFRGVATVFVFCSTFYAGVESIAVAATETRNPRRAVPLAIRQTFWRIIFVYMGSALFFGMTCPANATGLIGDSKAAVKSPMTIALQNAGFAGGVHLINAFIFVTCLSACNSSIYIGSRTLLYMGQNKKAPKILGWTDRRGVPIPAILLTNACGALSMMNLSTGAGKAYSYIVNLSGVSTFLVWASISFIHIRFRKGWAAQGYNASELPYRSWLYPWNAYFGLAANIFLALIQGWTTLVPFDAGGFVDAYILLPLFFVIYIVYKLIFKTKFWRVDEMDLQSGQRRDLDDIKKHHSDVGSNGVKPSLWKRLCANF